MNEPPGTGPDEQLTTDPPLPPGVPDVDELVGDPVREGGRPRAQPDGEDVADEDAADGDDATETVEPPD